MRTLMKCKDYYEGCFEEINEKKIDSLGKTMTLKEAMDLWWNSVRIDGGVYYKNCYINYGKYDCPRELLNKMVKLNEEYDYDNDGYPIIYGEFVE